MKDTKETVPGYPQNFALGLAASTVSAAVCLGLPDTGPVSTCLKLAFGVAVCATTFMKPRDPAVQGQRAVGIGAGLFAVATLAAAFNSGVMDRRPATQDMPPAPSEDQAPVFPMLP